MIVEWLSFIALVGYVFLTYLILREKYDPLVSFYLKKLEGASHIGFYMTNISRVEAEVFGIIWVKINNRLFEFKEGFYGNKKHWIVQPKTQVFGHFNLTSLKDENGKEILDYLKESKKNSISFNFEIKYRKTSSNFPMKLLIKIPIFRKWKKVSPQKYIHNFENDDFWLDV